ncbi:hypothetical protein [Maridesulfovibrio sp.]|uniref:hypothetical protein n=1 Tax=Maridesulfovibrio sp. TaxID=2795000 RepID=UPI003B0009B6
MNEAILQDLFNKRDRLIPQTGPELVEMNITDNDWEKTSLQWHEYATLDGLPVTVYYRTTPEDQARYKTSEDSDEPEWWEERIEKIELHKDFYGLMVEAEEKEREAEELREELRKIEESYRQNG